MKSHEEWNEVKREMVERIGNINAAARTRSAGDGQLQPLGYAAWRDCTESAPEDGIDVLVWTRWEAMLIAQRDWEQGGAPGHWVIPGEVRLELRDVTHWMPLPPVPTPMPHNGGSELRREARKSNNEGANKP